MADFDDQSDVVPSGSLRRIAQSLGVPVEALFERYRVEEPLRSIPSTEIARDATALLEAFLQLEGQSSRNLCVSFVQGLVERQWEAGGFGPASDPDGVVQDAMVAVVALMQERTQRRLTKG